MATAERFSIFPCSAVHAGGTMDLQQIENFTVSPNPTKATIILGGAVDPTHHGIASADPIISYGTRDLVTLFADVSISAGLALTGAGTFRLQERSDGGTFETGLTHETFTTTGGFIRCTSITADQESPDGAIANCELVPLWDGTTNPIVHNTGVDFAGAPAPTFASRFFLGPVYHNSVEIKGVTNVNIDPGVNYTARRFSGDPYAKLGAIVTRNPRFSFTVAKSDEGSALDVFGRALAGSLDCYLWKGVDSGTRVAVASTVHVKISAATGDWAHEDVSVTGNDDATTTFTVLPKSTISLVTNSAIP